MQSVLHVSCVLLFSKPWAELNCITQWKHGLTLWYFKVTLKSDWHCKLFNIFIGTSLETGWSTDVLFNDHNVQSWLTIVSCSESMGGCCLHNTDTFQASLMKHCISWGRASESHSLPLIGLSFQYASLSLTHLHPCGPFQSQARVQSTSTF